MGASAEETTPLRDQSRARSLRCDDRLVVALIFATWFITNLTINFYNKWLLGMTDFTFPLLYTSTNKIIGWFASLGILSASVATGKGQFPSAARLRAQFKRPMIHIHGVFTALNIGLNNWSLVFISLSINQLLRSIVPLPTAALSTVFEKKRFGWQIWVSMGVVCAGAMLASYGSGDASLFGILICLGSVFSGAAWTVVSGMLLQMGEEPLDSLSVLFCSSPTCILTTLVFAMALELPHIKEWFADESRPNVGAMFALYILVGGLLGFTYDLVHQQFIKVTSSMSMGIAGNAKMVLLIAISMIFLEHPPTPTSVVGIVIGLIGCFWYTAYKQWEAQSKAKAATVGITEKSGLVKS
jgi:drug/metabolite transporter (DMT)-like permease